MIPIYQPSAQFDCPVKIIIVCSGPGVLNPGNPRSRNPRIVITVQYCTVCKNAPN